VALAAAQDKRQRRPSPIPTRPGLGQLQRPPELRVWLRSHSIGGNGALYNTFVNLNPGRASLEQSLDMQSLDHHGVLFDNLSLSSFGYGGDQRRNRLRSTRTSSNHFSGLFRRDRNIWNYNLLANPLITTSVPTFRLLRRGTLSTLASDDRLEPDTVAHRVSACGWLLANVSDGPSLSTYHGADDTVLFQTGRPSLNSYRVGFDFKVLPRTASATISPCTTTRATHPGKIQLRDLACHGQPIDIAWLQQTVRAAPAPRR